MSARKQFVISTEDINESAVVFEDKGEPFSLFTCCSCFNITLPRHLRFLCKLLGSILKSHFADESEEDDENDNTNITEEVSPLSDDNENDSNNDSEVCRIS